MFNEELMEKSVIYEIVCIKYTTGEEVHMSDVPPVPVQGSCATSVYTLHILAT